MQNHSRITSVPSPRTSSGPGLEPYKTEDLQSKTKQNESSLGSNHPDSLISLRTLTLLHGFLTLNTPTLLKDLRSTKGTPYLHATTTKFDSLTSQSPSDLIALTMNQTARLVPTPVDRD